MNGKFQIHAIHLHVIMVVLVLTLEVPSRVPVQLATVGLHVQSTSMNAAQTLVYMALALMETTSILVPAMQGILV